MTCQSPKLHIVSDQEHPFRLFRPLCTFSVTRSIPSNPWDPTHQLRYRFSRYTSPSSPPKDTLRALMVQVLPKLSPK